MTRPDKIALTGATYKDTQVLRSILELLWPMSCSRTKLGIDEFFIQKYTGIYLTGDCRYSGTPITTMAFIPYKDVLNSSPLKSLKTRRNKKC